MTIAFLFLYQTFSYAAIKKSEGKKQSGTDITTKFKQAIEALGSKVNEAITFVKKHTGTLGKYIPNIGGNKKKVLEIEMHIPPPDVEIFRDEPINIMLRRPNVYFDEDAGVYAIEDVWVFINSGENAGESMHIAYKNAIDIAFSQLVLDYGVGHLYFTIADATDCLVKMDVISEHFHKNEYIGSFAIHFNAEAFEKIIWVKKHHLFLKGLDEYSRPMRTVPTKVKIKSKEYWAELEKRLVDSGTAYVIAGMTKDTAIVLLGRKDGENIMKKLEDNGMKIDLDNKQYFLEFLEQKD